MGSGYRVGLYGVGDVLVNSAVSPPDSVGVGVIGFPRFDSAHRSHSHLAVAGIFDAHRIGQEAVASILTSPPTPDMV